MTTCPNCGGERVHRVEARMAKVIPLDVVDGWRLSRRVSYWAGYNSCWDCWHTWDGITEPLGLTLPIGVIERVEEDNDGN